MSFIKDKIILFLLVLTVVVNIISWISLLTQIKPQEEPVVLHYNVKSGVDLIGNWKRVFRMPLAGVVVLVLNFFLAKFFYQREKLISYFLAGGSLWAQILILVASILIILVNKP